MTPSLAHPLGMFVYDNFIGGSHILCRIVQIRDVFDSSEHTLLETGKRTMEYVNRAFFNTLSPFFHSGSQPERVDGAAARE